MRIDLALEVEATLGQITDETAGKAVASTGGIKDVVEEVSGHHEEAIGTEEHRTVFAALNDQIFGAHGHDLGCGLTQVGLAGKQLCFRVVDQQEVPVGDGFEEYFDLFARLKRVSAILLLKCFILVDS